MKSTGTIAAIVMLMANTAGAAEINVKIGNFVFLPTTVTVHVGDKIKWANEDDSPHTVTETGSRFHSVALDTGDTYVFTFASKGEFTYFCSLHPHMVGKVVVIE